MATAIREIPVGFGPYYPEMSKLDVSSLDPSDVKGLGTDKGVVGWVDSRIWAKIEADMMPPGPSVWKKTGEAFKKYVLPVFTPPFMRQRVMDGEATY